MSVSDRSVALAFVASQFMAAGAAIALGAHLGASSEAAGDMWAIGRWICLALATGWMLAGAGLTAFVWVRHQAAFDERPEDTDIGSQTPQETEPGRVRTRA